MAKLKGQLFARLALDYFDHPKIMALSAEAIVAHLEMIVYSRKYGTDGAIPMRFAMRFADHVLDELANNDPEKPSIIRNDDGTVTIYGYADMQETSDQIEKRRQVRREAGQAGANARWQRNGKPHSNSHGKPHGKSNGKKMAETETETETDIYPYKSPTGDGKRGGYTEAFERFWKVYPKSADKRTAFNAWKRAVKRADPETIMAGAERYRDDPNRDPADTKNGSTWLNADAWLNDPLPPRGGSGPQTFDQQRIQANNDLFMEIAGSVAGGDAWNSDSFNRQIQQ